MTSEQTNLPAERQDYSAKWWDPRNPTEARDLAKDLAGTQLVPQAFRGKPADIFVSWSLGAPLGLSLLASLRHIAVINGTPSLWGDGMLAVVRGHPDCEGVEETINGEGDAMEAVCAVSRRGEKPVVRTFSVQDAKTAGLWGKNVWKSYPRRMLQMRARGFACRDAFADALCGMPLAEEVRDITSEVTVLDEPEGATATERLRKKLEAEKSVGGPATDAPDPQGDGDLSEHAGLIDDVQSLANRLGMPLEDVLEKASEKWGRTFTSFVPLATAQLREVLEWLKKVDAQREAKS